jgi:hypothetical protein
MTDYISNLKGSDNGWLTNDEALEVYPRDLINAVQEAVISMACLIDDPDYIIKLNNEDTKNIVSDADLDHINEQLLVIADRLKIGRNSLPMDTSPVQVGYSAMDIIQPDWLPCEIDGEIYHIEIDVDEGVNLSIWDWDKKYDQIGEQINDGWRIDNHDKKEFA